MRRQRLSLDPPGALSYIAACALLAGCVPPPAPLIPVPLAAVSRDSAVAWTAARLPGRRAAIRFRFKYQDSDKRWGGRGTARIAPPDSLRFDYVGPLGLGAGAAAVVGDSELWADPEKNFRSLVPAVRMLWAALGVVRPPAAGAAVFTLVQPGPEGPRELWRFVDGADTLDYVATAGTARVLEAQWRRAGKVYAGSTTALDARGAPTSARIVFPEARARFELTVAAIDTAAVFDPAMWRGRH